MFRLHRDVRFSADRSPCKTRQALFCWKGADRFAGGERRTAPGFSLSLEPDLVVLGVGMMRLGDLGRWRQALDEAGSGPRFDVALAEACVTGDVEATEPDLVRVPRPYPADHPRGEWLRRRRVILSRGLAAPSQLYEATLVEWCAQRLEPFAAMHRWLVRHVSKGA